MYHSISYYFCQANRKSNNTKFLISENEKKIIFVHQRLTTAGLVAQVFFIFRSTFCMFDLWPIPRNAALGIFPIMSFFWYVWSTKSTCLGCFVQMMWLLVNSCFFLGIWVLVVVVTKKKFAYVINPQYKPQTLSFKYIFR